MYLKSIEVHGFKSFYNKMMFEFHDGITAIVGPNGSGKSNVADAVRWVLGEQSAKQLRGARMEDVIFSGTENRKPMGYAYVAITLDNSDHQLPVEYEEVTVARRVYRSGDSEYLINGTSCRLRDVQDLFLDTGIGKEGYSIIGQGQIEKILSGRPDERRELFDEAAGIVKYKKRKQTAERNLLQERENLTRAKDILSVQEQQLGPLERKAETARKYLDYREELKQYDVSMFVQDVERIEKSLESLGEKHSIIEADIEKTKSDVEKSNYRIDELENEEGIKDRELSETQEKISKSKSDLEKSDSDIRVFKATIEEKEKTRTSLKERIKKSEKDQQQKQKEIDAKKKDCETIISQEKVHEKKKNALEEQLNQVTEKIFHNTREIEEGNQQILELLQSNSELQVQLASIQTLEEQNSKKHSEFSRRVIENKGDESTIKDEIKKLEEKLSEQEMLRKEAEEVQNTLKDELELLKEDIKKVRKERDEAHASEIRSQARLDSLKNVAERYEGYGAVIQRVMEQKERIDGIVGVVSDIFKVKKEHETAIETALGGNIRNIITRNDTTAKQLIGFLKRNKYGRATFLPLTSVKSRGLFRYPDALNEKGVIGTANTLVETSKQFEVVVEYLLGQVLVVDTIDHAISIEKKYNQSLRIVTLEGELLNPGGSMTGGAFKNTSNLLGRGRELEELEAAIKESHKRERELENHIKQLESQKGKKQKITDDHAKKMQEIVVKIREINVEKRTRDKELEKNKKKFEQIQNERILLDQADREIKAQKAELENGSGDYSEQNQIISARNEKLGRENDMLRKEEEKLRGELSEAQIAYSGVHQQVTSRQEMIERIENELAQLKSEHASLLEEIADCEKEVSEKKDRIREIASNKTELEAALNQFREIKNKIISEKGKITAERKEAYKHSQQIAENMSSMTKEEERLANQIEKLTEQKDQHFDYMWDEYQLTISDCEGMEMLSLPFDELKKGVSERREKMKALGPVDVNAIDEYHELSAQYNELKKQHDDLVEAEKVLLDTIEELDQLMREQFEEKFIEIKEQFQLVFKELFGGGKADLELVEEDDILEAGIRINAQPPGKKLQNMMQLSGGEKALTAICLLFAIQNLKPSPFCLLDEIEAALDDSNVVRYAKYLHKLTEHTQFIVITHRHGTMEAADRLYGITMQEKGVSTLVSIDLIEESITD